MQLKLALPKGSLQDSTLELMRKAGFHCTINSRSYFPWIDDEELEVLDEAMGRNWGRYPDFVPTEVKTRLGERHGLGPDHILVGNGSNELSQATFLAAVGRGDRVVLSVPTFTVYALMNTVMDGDLCLVLLKEGLTFDVDRLAEKAAKPGTKLVILCSPNNPTGNMASEDQVRKLLDLGVVVVVDEAYYEYCGQTAMTLLNEYPNLIVLRTFSKWAGLAGLRVGLGVMDPKVAQLMMTIKPPYNMNRAAELALLASLEDRDLLMSRIKPVVEERERLAALLKTIPGVTPVPSQANFMMVRLPQGRGIEIFRALAERGVFVRYYDETDMKDCLRVSVGLPYETDGFIQALRQVV